MTMTAEMIEQNRKHIEATTPVPPGWMKADNADPITQQVMFWNSPLQVWSDVATTLTNPDEYAKFMQLWEAGSTFLIVPAPVAPAPVAAPFAAPFAQAPAIPTPAPAPAPVVAPAPPAPVAVAPVVQNLAVPPAPAFVPPAPVAAVSFPAPPAPAPVVEQPQAPAPAPASGGLKVVGLGKKPAPQASAVPAPVNVQDSISQAVAAGEKAGAVVDTPAHPKPQDNPASLALLERFAKVHAAMSAQLKELAEGEKALRAEIVKLAFPNGVTEGVNTCNLPDGSALVVTGKVNRTVDPAKATVVRENLAAVGASFDDYFEWKPSLKTGSFKVATVNLQAIMAEMVTAKEGTPSVELRKPKGV